jgi:hypothetical protein
MGVVHMLLRVVGLFLELNFWLLFNRVLNTLLRIRVCLMSRIFFLNFYKCFICPLGTVCWNFKFELFLLLSQDNWFLYLIWAVRPIRLLIGIFFLNFRLRTSLFHLGLHLSHLLSHAVGVLFLHSLCVFSRPIRLFLIIVFLRNWLHNLLNRLLHDHSLSPLFEINHRQLRFHLLNS